LRKKKKRKGEQNTHVLRGKEERKEKGAGFYFETGSIPKNVPFPNCEKGRKRRGKE